MAPKGQQLPLPGQLAPRPGDRVLRFTRHWLALALAGTKTAEVRRGRTTPGGAWLGCAGCVWGYASLGEPVHMATLADFQTRRQEHRMDVVELPYGSHTFLWPLSEVRALPVPVQFRNTPGPVTWLPFVEPEAQVVAAASESRGRSRTPRRSAGRPLYCPVACSFAQPISVPLIWLQLRLASINCMSCG